MLSLICLFVVLAITLESSSEYSYPKGLPCKVYNTTRLDCSRRRLTDVPPLSHSTGNVKRLDLSYNLLESIKSEYWSHLTALEELDLSHNKLEFVNGMSFIHLTALEKLDLSCNQLQLVHRTSFNKLSLLKELNVSCNKINEITFEALLPLQVLDLSFNSIISINTNTFVGLRNLEILNVSFQVSLTLYGHPFSSMPSLQKIVITQNQLRILPQEVFRGLNKLEVLDVSGNSIDLLPSDTFRNMVNLRYLTLHSVFECSDFRSCRLANETFMYTINLEHLDLSYNQLPNLPETLFANLTHLKYLDLHGTEIYSIPETLFVDLTSLEYVDLSISNNIIIIPHTLFATLTNLQYLDVSFNPRLISIPCETISSLHMLQVLNMSYLKDFNYSSCSFDNTTNLKVLRTSAVETWNETTWMQVLTQIPVSLHTLELLIPTPSFAVIEFQSVTPGAVQNSSISSLQIRYCSYSRICTLHVEEDAFSMFPYLQHLAIQAAAGHRFCITGSNISKHAFDNLLFLKSLDLHDNCLTDVSFGVFGDTLKHLDLSWTFMDKLSVDLQKINLQLETLDISGNDISDLNLQTLGNVTRLYFNYSDSQNIKVQTLSPALQYLSISGRLGHFVPNFVQVSYMMNVSLCTQAPEFKEIVFSRLEFFTDYQLAWGSCVHLRILAISDSNGVFLNNIDNHTFPHLESLTLTNCKLSSIQLYLLESHHLQYIDLSHNKLESLPAKQFQHMSSLTYLNLRGNKLVSLNALKGLHRLETFYVDENALTTLPSFLFKTHHSLQQIGFGNNSYYCSCDNIPLQDWILRDLHTYIDPQLLYFCTDPSNSQQFGITEFSLDCSLHLEYYIPPIVIGILVISIVSGVVYKYHRQIQYKLWVLCYQRRYLQYLNNDDDADILNEEEEDDVDARRVAPILRRRYHAYVAYHRETDLWVNEQLIPNIEDGPEQFRLCMKERGDVPPGHYILNAITHGIYKSRKTIIVLSENFMDDGWCHYQLQIAQMRMVRDKEDVIILVQIGEIPEYRKTLLLRQLLRTKGVLKWTENADGKALFWNQLKMKLRQPIHVNRRIQEA